MKIKAIICLIIDMEDKMYPVRFSGKNAAQIHGYLQHIQGGSIKVIPEPQLLVSDTPEIRAAVDAIVNPPSEPPKGFVRRFFGGMRSVASQNNGTTAT